MTTVAQILDAVAAEFGVPVVQLVGERRSASIVLPRHVAMHLAVRLTGNSLPGIGRRMGGRDHTTIMHGDRRVAALRKDAPALDARVRRLEATLQGAPQ
jgi:chromosomal replication initiator protein